MPVQRNSTHQPLGTSVPAPVSPDEVRPSTAAPAPAAAPAERSVKPARTRTGATWVGVCIGALLLVALIVFMLQNTAAVDVTFLGMTGTAPLALVLLIAGVAVGLVALVIGTLRIGQLRRRIRADRRQASALPRPTR